MNTMSTKSDRRGPTAARAVMWGAVLATAAGLAGCDRSADDPQEQVGSRADVPVEVASSGAEADAGGAVDSGGGADPAPRPMEDQPLEIELLAERSRVRPGEQVYLGIHLKPEEGFHTYWKHPGVVGVPTAVDWHLPDGWEAGEIEWPAPEVVMMGPYPAHGYGGEVLLPVAITVPEDAPDGKVTLGADVQWMCCADTCHPGFRTFEIAIEVDEEAPASGLDPMFEQALEARPVAAKGFEFEAERDATHVTMVIRGRSDAGVDATPLKQLGDLRFYCDQGVISSGQAQVAEPREDGSLHLRMEASAFAPEEVERLSGVLESEGGWFLDESGEPVRFIRVNMPLPPAPAL